MSRRKNSSPPISLFSFQDIITSVTAIIIVIVMTLSLELLDQKDTSSEISEAQVVTDLQTAVDLTKSEISTIQSEIAKADGSLEQAAGLSPAELAMLTLEEELVVKARRNLAEGADARKKELDLKRTALQRRKDAAAPTKARKDQLEAEVPLLQGRAASMRGLRRPVYCMPRGSNRSGWIVVVTDSECDIAPVGRAQPPERVVFKMSGILGFGNSKRDQLISRCGGKDGLYLFVLVRPDGADTFDKLQRELDGSGISYGYDLIGQDEEILDARAGAWFE